MEFVNMSNERDKVDPSDLNFSDLFLDGNKVCVKILYRMNYYQLDLSTGYVESLVTNPVYKLEGNLDYYAS